MNIVTISEIMVRDHDKIVKLLNELGNYINLDKQTLKKVFDTFRWELEKHIFTEERVIFISYNPEDKEEGYTMIPQLMIDHKNILDRLKEIQKRIKSDKNCNFQDFKEFLIQHKDFEENFFYPKLDQELDETTKDMIFKRIGEIKLDEKVFKKIKLKCSECGKKLGILEGYHYPKLEKRWFFCRKCYDEVEKDKQAKKKYKVIVK